MLFACRMHYETMSKRRPTGQVMQDVSWLSFVVFSLRPQTALAPNTCQPMRIRPGPSYSMSTQILHVANSQYGPILHTTVPRHRWHV